MTNVRCIILTWLFFGAFAAVAKKPDFYLQIVQSQYLSEKTLPEHLDNSSDFIGELNWSVDQSKSASKIDLKWIQSFTYTKESYLTSREIYTCQLYSDSRICAGRMLFEWNEHDVFWRQSIWQPNFNWNSIMPEVQGLTGFFWVKETLGLKLSAFISTLYLPDQGINVETKNGRLVSTNRWFNQNVQAVELGQLESPLIYEIDKPSVSNIVFQNSYAFYVGTQSDNNILLNLAFADKPINQFQFHLEAIHEAKITSGLPPTRLTVHPGVARHTVGSLDLGWRSKNMKVFGSVISEQPRQSEALDSWETLSFPDQTIYGISGFVNGLAGLPLEIGASFQWQQIESFEGETKDFISEESNQLLSRRFFQKAFLLEAKVDLQKWSQSQLQVLTRYVHDFDAKGDVLHLGFDWQGRQQVGFKGGIEILGVEREDIESPIRRFRGNDRVWVGVSYVF